jgi:hypothetical protein
MTPCKYNEYKVVLLGPILDILKNIGSKPNFYYPNGFKTWF